MNPLKIGDLTIPVPIVQGGMGIGISLSGLASAVANAGGIGVIATVGVGLIHGTPECSYKKNNIDGVVKEIRRARELSNGVLGVNIMTVLTNYDELVQSAFDEKIDVIFSGAGLPLELPKFRPAGSHTKMVPIVSSGRAASIIAQKWMNNYQCLPDAIVVEGPKAGGHLGFKFDDLAADNIELKDLVKEVLEVANGLKAKYNKEIPVIAGGGLMSGKDIYDIMQVGASAVQLGSRFIATEECDASKEFKEAILNSDAKSVRIIKSPVGMPGRAVENDFLLAAERGERRPTNCKFNCIKSCNPKTTQYCIADALLAAYLGNLSNGFAFSGAYGYKITSISTVSEIFRELIGDYQNEKNNNQG